MEIRRIKDKYTQKENQEEIKENKKIMKDKNKLPKKYC